MGGVIFITTISLFHFFRTLETSNNQKSEMFLLRISSGNVNESAVVTCQHPHFIKKFP